MKTVKIREFQKKFYQYIKAGEDVCLVRESGEIVGYFSYNAKSSDGRASASSKFSIETAILENPDGRASESQERVFCTKCKKRQAEMQGKHWENGDEMDVNLCRVCFSAVPNKRGYRTIE